MLVRRLATAACALAITLMTGGTAAQATVHQTIAVVGANQSTNWSGYNQGTVERGGTLFNSISGTWVVPTARQHKSGQAEYSSTWIGIGGGCIDAGCLTTDGTLIQTGTEQDVSKGGSASYSAWWELIPAPSIMISGFKVHAGDTMHATIAEVAPASNVWTITLKDVTDGASFSQTVPYSSTHLTAEWIEETPLLISTNGTGFTALPNLGTVHFTAASVNGQNAGLKASEEVQLVDSNGHALATPSAPNRTATAFNDCTYSTTCAAPTSSAKHH